MLLDMVKYFSQLCSVSVLCSVFPPYIYMAVLYTTFIPLLMLTSVLFSTFQFRVSRGNIHMPTNYSSLRKVSSIDIQTFSSVVC